MILKWLTPELREDLELKCATWSIPLGVIVGWIEKESGGNPKSTTRLREAGLFQILPAESKDMGFDHNRIFDDTEYGIECGFELANYYRTIAKRIAAQNAIGSYALPGSEYMWELAKLGHCMGSGCLRTVVSDASAKGMANSWESLRNWCISQDVYYMKRLHHSTAKWANFVEEMFEIGRPYGTDGLICQKVNT